MLLCLRDFASKSVTLDTLIVCTLGTTVGGIVIVALGATATLGGGANVVGGARE